MSKNITRTLKTTTCKAYVVLAHDEVAIFECNAIGAESKKTAIVEKAKEAFANNTDVILFDIVEGDTTEKLYTMPVNVFTANAHKGKKPTARGWVTANKAQTITKALVLTDDEKLEVVEMDTTGADTFGQVAKLFKNAGYNFIKVKDTEKNFTSYYMSERDFAELAESLNK